MGIKAKVVNVFKETEHDGHIYSVGDVYPAEGYEADSKRVEFLSQVHPKYKKIFLADVESDGGKDIGSSTDEFPKHTGGGWYELSNGEKVQGKDEAIEEEAKLKSGD